MLIIFIILSPIVAAFLAYFWYWYQLRRATKGDYDIITNGCWQTNRRGEGSKEALRVHRARIAKHAGFGMNRDEAIYWGADFDSNGNQIMYNHKYRVEGVDPDTRWWCLSVNRDGFFIPNQFNRYSFSKTDVKRDKLYLRIDYDSIIYSDYGLDYNHSDSIKIIIYPWNNPIYLLSYG
ncbi:MAG: DUF1214 domain-containing protein [Promethearchaeota archaeon]